MTDHEKRIREAVASGENFSDNDLRALLADLDAMRGALEAVRAAIYMDDAGQLRLTHSFDESVIEAALAAHRKETT